MGALLAEHLRAMVMARSVRIGQFIRRTAFSPTRSTFTRAATAVHGGFSSYSPTTPSASFSTFPLAATPLATTPTLHAGVLRSNFMELLSISEDDDEDR